jgi:DNA-binding transcriptional MerR regulator
MANKLSKKERLIPIGDSSDFLNVSVDTIRRWDKAGILHSIRPDGKNRYFSIDELEKVKYAQPLSIIEAAQRLKVSPSTLRRHEKKGLIKPDRNKNGERIYSKKCIEDYINIKLASVESQPKITEIITETMADKPNSSEKIESTYLSQLILNQEREIKKIKQFRKLAYRLGVFLAAIYTLMILIMTMFIAFCCSFCKCHRNTKNGIGT